MINIYKQFFLQVHFLLVSSLILFPLFATCIVDTGGKFTAGIVSNFYQLTHTLSLTDIATSLSIIVVSYFLYARNPVQSVLEFLNSSMGARSRVGIGLSGGYRAARLHRLTESIPGLLKSFKIQAGSAE